MTPAGDETDFTDLFRTYGPALFAFAKRRLGDDASSWDVVNDAFLVAWRRPEALPSMPQDQLPWLYGIAGNVVRNATRTRSRQARLVARLSSFHVPGRSADPADVVIARAQPGTVLEALARLPAADQEILRLVAWEELGLAAVATVLNLTPGTARVRLHRARRRLERAIGASGNTSHAASSSGLSAVKRRPPSPPSSTDAVSISREPAT